MTRIDFYILQSDNDQARLDFSCRLIEKAFSQGNRVLIQTESLTASNELDHLLWYFKPESYVPHVIHAHSDTTEFNLSEPVVISHEADKINLPETSPPFGLLLNMSHDVPVRFKQHTRYAQIVNQSPKRLEASRKHFAFFKEQGYSVEVNKINR